MPSAPPPDPTRCPLCGGDNACALQAAGAGSTPSQVPCWCFSPAAQFPQALLARVPASCRGQACLCARCAAGAATPTEEPLPCP